jgi:CMP-N,N'-diacetyllegionaminic acid synthase
MIDNKRILAIIPARGGSKRLPRKNILDLAGKPLIVWTIEAALKSEYIDRVIVSTEDDEIATISKKYGADVPFMRPNELATDKIQSIDVVINVINTLKIYDDNYDYVILLQPTSPLRTVKDIDKAFKLLIQSKSGAIISVCKNEHSPLWSDKLPKDMDMSDFISESIKNKRSQELEQYYRLNGAIYICNIQRLIDEKTFNIENKCKAYVMNRQNSIDIDTIDDLNMARFQVDKSIVQKAEMADNLYRSYKRIGFGKLLKSEINLMMFDFSVKKILTDINSNIIINNEVNYFKIDKEAAYFLSKELVLLENKVQLYVEKIGLLKGFLDKKKGIVYFLELIVNQKQDEKLLKEGKLRCDVSNKLLRSFIESRVIVKGGIPNYSFNRNILIFDLSVFLKICEKQNEIISRWVETQNDIFNNKETKKIIQEITVERKTLNYLSMDISKIIFSKFIGDNGFKVLQDFIGIIKK